MLIFVNARPESSFEYFSVKGPQDLDLSCHLFLYVVEVFNQPCLLVPACFPSGKAIAVIV